MKKQFTLFLLAFLCASCGVSIKSVVDSDAIKEPYKNPLIVITYEEYSTRNFSEKLKDKLELQFAEENKKVEFLLFEQGNDKLTLNQNDDINAKISSAIRADQKDIVLIFRPSNLGYYNGGLQSATYQLTGIDAMTQKEVWKATFNSNSSLGPALFAEKSAKKIIEKLKLDKIL